MLAVVASLSPPCCLIQMGLDKHSDRNQACPPTSLIHLNELCKNSPRYLIASVQYELALSFSMCSHTAARRPLAYQLHHSLQRKILRFIIYSHHCRVIQASTAPAVLYAESQ